MKHNLGIRENPYGQTLKNANNARYSVKNGEIMNRRNFLKGMLAASMAPAICKAEWLMPARNIIVPDKALIIPTVMIDASSPNMVFGQVYTISAYVSSKSKGWERVSKTFKYDGTNSNLEFGKETSQVYGLQLENTPAAFFNGRSEDWGDGLEIRTFNPAGFKDMPGPSTVVQGHVKVPVLSHQPIGNTFANFDNDFWTRTKLGELS